MAAIAVACLHAVQIDGGRFPWPVQIGLAVDFFFCLSGFVVAHAYDTRLQGGGMCIAAFTRKRLHRLYPMIAASVVLGTAALLSLDRPFSTTLIDGAFGLLMVPPGLWNGGILYPVDPPMWSLLFELLASLGYALMARLTPARWLPWIVGALGSLLALAGLVHGNVVGFGTSAGLGLLAVPLRVGYPFLLGVLFHRLELHAHVPRVPAWAILIALVAILFTPVYARGPFQALASVLLLPAVVLFGARVETRLAPLWNRLGRLSYPLYLVHFPVLLVTVRLLGERLPTLGFVTAGVVTSCLVAWAVLALFDEPVRRWRPARQVTEAGL